MDKMTNEELVGNFALSAIRILKANNENDDIYTASVNEILARLNRVSELEDEIEVSRENYRLLDKKYDELEKEIASYKEVEDSLQKEIKRLDKYVAELEAQLADEKVMYKSLLEHHEATDEDWNKDKMENEVLREMNLGLNASSIAGKKSIEKLERIRLLETISHYDDFGITKVYFADTIQEILAEEG